METRKTRVNGMYHYIAQYIIIKENVPFLAYLSGIEPGFGMKRVVSFFFIFLYFKEIRIFKNPSKGIP